MLLMAKTAGLPTKFEPTDLDEGSGLLKTQRTLADAVELTCYGNDIHREGVLNMQHMQCSGIGENAAFWLFAQK